MGRCCRPGRAGGAPDRGLLAFWMNVTFPPRRGCRRHAPSSRLSSFCLAPGFAKCGKCRGFWTLEFAKCETVFWTSGFATCGRRGFRQMPNSRHAKLALSLAVLLVCSWAFFFGTIGVLLDVPMVPHCLGSNRGVGIIPNSIPLWPLYNYTRIASPQNPILMIKARKVRWHMLVCFLAVMMKSIEVIHRSLVT